jgi:hypothetical protein
MHPTLHLFFLSAFKILEESSQSVLLTVSFISLIYIVFIISFKDLQTCQETLLDQSSHSSEYKEYYLRTR